MPRPAWDQSEAIGGDLHEGEPAPVQPVQPCRTLRAKSVLARTVNTENESRIKTRAVSHRREARSGFPAGIDNGQSEREKGKETC